jgi:hypothetical protein
MATVIEMCNTEEQNSGVGRRTQVQRIFIKECFLFTLRNVCRVKLFITGSRNSLKDVRKVSDDETELRKRLRQQSKDFYAAGFDALVKRWDKCINVAGGHTEK